MARGPEYGLLQGLASLRRRGRGAGEGFASVAAPFHSFESVNATAGRVDA